MALNLFRNTAEIWQPHRKQLIKSFNYESLKSYIHVFQKHGNKLVSVLDSCTDVPVAHLIHDAILEIITGKNINMVEN